MWKIGIGVVLVLLLAAAMSGLVIGYKAGISGQFNLGLQRLVMLLSEPSSERVDLITLGSEVVVIGGEEKLRCTLINVSNQAIRIAEQALPCKRNHAFAVVGVSANGRFMPQQEELFSMLTTDSPPVELAAGKTLTIDENLASLYPLEATPRKMDALLLWSYRFEKHTYTGIALLPKKKVH